MVTENYDIQIKRNPWIGCEGCRGLKLPEFPHNRHMKVVNNNNNNNNNLPGAELSLFAKSFDLLNDLLLPFLSILDATCPIFGLHLGNVLFDVILPSVLGSSL